MHFSVQKNFGFFEIYGVSERKGDGRASADILQTRWVFQMHFSVQKTSDFLKVIVCPNGKGMEKPVWTFCRQGGGVNFLLFCADVFYGRPLFVNFKKVFNFLNSISIWITIELML